MDSSGSANAEVAGGVKLPDAVHTITSELLEPSGKTLTLSSEPSFNTSNVLCHKTSSSHSKVAPNDTSLWQEKAFEFYEQVAQQVERLLQSVCEEEVSMETRDELKQACIPSGHHNKMIQTVDAFSRKTNMLVMLLQRIKLQKPIVLEPLSL